MTILSAQEIAALYQDLPHAQQEQISEIIAAASSTALPTVKGAKSSRRANCSQRAIGRLLFQENGSDGQPRPLHNMWIEVWDRDLGGDDVLGIGETDFEGRFEIWYDPADAGRFDKPDLELRVYELRHHYKAGKLQFYRKLLFAVAGDDNVTAPTFDFGDVRLPYWEYDPKTPTPRLMIVSNSNPPQSFGPGRTVVMLKNLAPLELVKRKHFFINAVSAHLPSIESIQHDYSDCLTLRLQRERPGYTRGDEFFGERILNGMTASIMDRDPANPDLFWIHHHWNSYEHDGEHAAPNVDMWFELRDGKLFPVKIRLHFRQRDDLSANPQMQEPVTYTPADGDRWLQAKRVARVSAALASEMDVHLAQTHLNTEQYAIAAYRNIRKSPLRFLLLPHLKEVVLINHEADRWLLGPQGFVTRSAALTADAWGQRLRQVVGTLDWKNWTPRRPICDGHSYARAANLYWEVLTEFVDNFFTDNEAGIVAHWDEVHRFSHDLIEHSAPFFLCQFLQSVMLDKEGQFNPAANDWFDLNERMDLAIPRHEINGQRIAVQPITLADEPGEDGIESMKQVARYVIFHATFFHSWPNSRQLDDCGEIVYSGMGLRYGDNGVMTPESDLSVAPPPDRASEQLWFANALTKTEFGFIMTNEDHDIHPQFANLLRARRSEFAELGVNIYKIQSRTNI